MLPTPTPELIADGVFVEGPSCDLKQQVDLADPRQKSNIVDDAVAFLNTRAGHVLIGVKERGGHYDGFAPLQGDPEARANQLLSVLQDNIDPKPLRLEVRPPPVAGGFLLDVDIPEHVMRPYQNRLTGGFYVRTGAKNTPIPRDQMGAHFVALERYEQDAARRLTDVRAQLAARNAMVTGAATLDIAILPRAFYEKGRPMFQRGQGVLKSAPQFHSRNAYFTGCQGGHETIEIDFSQKGVSRTFIGNDWFLHGQAVYPVSTANSGRAMFPEFKDKLQSYLNDVAALLDGEGIGGPFCVLLAMSGLRADEKLGWLFETADVVELPHGAIVERVDDTSLVETFYNLVISSSRFG